MNKNVLSERPKHIANLRPLLVGLAISPAEKARLHDLRRQLAEVEAQLDKVSNPSVKKAVGALRTGLRHGTATGDNLQDALRLEEDSREIRRGLKSRLAEIGRALAGALEPIFVRAVLLGEKGLAELRKETGERIAKYFPGIDAENLIAVDLCVDGVATALHDLKGQAENMRTAQAEDSRWRPYSSTIDRLLAPLTGGISPA